MSSTSEPARVLPSADADTVPTTTSSSSTSTSTSSRPTPIVPSSPPTFDKDAAIKRVRPIAAVKPDMDRTLAEEVRTILHQAVIQPAFHSYREVAEATRAGLARATKQGDWSVILSRGLFNQARNQKGYCAIFSVPCLLGDLPASGIPRPEHRFSAVIFKTAGDPEYIVGKHTLAILMGENYKGDRQQDESELQRIRQFQQEQQQQQQLTQGETSNGGKSDGSTTTTTTTADEAAAAANRVLDANISTSEQQQSSTSISSSSSTTTPPPPPPPQPPTSLRYIPATPLSGTHVVRNSIATRRGLETVLEFIGGAQRTFGLNDATERTFTQAVKAALTDEFGSTWHVILGRSDAPPSAGGAVLVNSGTSSSTSSSTSSAAMAARIEAYGTAGIDASAHLPHFACIAAKCCFLEVWCAPHFLQGKRNAGEMTLKATPARYHVCVFRTGPGEGEPKGSGGSGNIMLDSSSSMLSTFWNNKVSTLRTIMFAAAVASLISYCLLIFWSNNDCSRIVAYGMRGGTYGESYARQQLHLMQQAGEPTIFDSIEFDTSETNASASEESSSSSSKSVEKKKQQHAAEMSSVAAQLALGPLPPLDPVSLAQPAPAVPITTLLTLPFQHLSTAMGIGKFSTSSGAKGLDAYLDSLVPTLPPENPQGKGQNEYTGIGGGGGIVNKNDGLFEDEIPVASSTSSSSSSPNMGDDDDASSSSSFPESGTEWFSTEALGVPASCTREEVILADRRILRSRSLVYSTLIFLAVAYVLRIIGRSSRRSGFRGVLHSMNDIAKQKKS